ncbi:MAG TPA: CHAP domain-containing protein [Candidatus Lumbricidophila sp.]|nr:CHAP domain-containing protein [Candidatus Lumbricidophila sp.]
MATARITRVRAIPGGEKLLAFGRDVRRPLRRKLAPVAALVIVPAILGTMALPAFALNPAPADAEAVFTATITGSQAVTASELVEGAVVAHDTYAVTTKSQLAASAAAAARARAEAEAAAWRAQAASIVRQPGDDYPYFTGPVGGMSPLRYGYRECVDFVAWRLNRDAGVLSAPWRWDWASMRGAGDAESWANGWARHGWPTSKVPVVGAVAWYAANHVAYVNSINADGSVNLEEYNWGGDHRYHRRTVPANEPDLYLYPPR